MMTPAEQNIAIAEACGWKRDNKVNEWLRPSRSHIPQFHSSWFGIDQLPNYLSDLNAMHEAEKVLIGPQAILYERMLENMVRAQARTQPGDRYPRAATICSWHATAAQRAEAFLKTIGKWKD